VPDLIARGRRLVGRVGGALWHSPTLPLMLLAGFVLAHVEPSYNHLVGAYALVGLLALNLKLWQGRASTSDLALPAAFLFGAGWMAWHGSADIVPYLAILYFALAAAACAVQLVLRRPATFREAGRVAENYLDTGLKGLLALTGVALGLAWIPAPRYLAVPFAMLLGFRLATPLRRLLYPLALRAVGLLPTSGAAAAPAAPRSGYSPARVAALAASVAAAAVVAPRLVFTDARYDLTIPKPYAMPQDLLQARRAELESYIAQPPGSTDPAALTELGLVLHELGLTDGSELARARVVLERAMALDPSNAQAVAWYGSTIAAEALHEERPLPRTRLVADGLAQLDRAVGMAPDDPIVRLARASVSLGMPDFIGRLPTAREDIARLIELARTHPRETDPILPFVYQRAGDTYARLGETALARTYWQAALAELPEESSDYRTIAGRLAALGGPRTPPHLVDGASAAEVRP
jgi:tetratricopeptide (TPR) repeat protein